VNVNGNKTLALHYLTHIYACAHMYTQPLITHCHVYIYQSKLLTSIKI